MHQVGVMKQSFVSFVPTQARAAELPAQRVRIRRDLRDWSDTHRLILNQRYLLQY